MRAAYLVLALALLSNPVSAQSIVTGKVTCFDTGNVKKTLDPDDLVALMVHIDKATAKRDYELIFGGSGDLIIARKCDGHLIAHLGDSLHCVYGTSGTKNTSACFFDAGEWTAAGDDGRYSCDLSYQLKGEEYFFNGHCTGSNRMSDAVCRLDFKFARHFKPTGGCQP